MSRRGRIVLKVAVWAGCLTPAVLLAHRAWTNTLGANPISELTNVLGDWAFRLLLASLAMTPLRILFGLSWPISLRRLLGLFAFAYAALHFLVWVVLDQYFDWPSMLKDIVKRPYITVGMGALVLLIPLAATSTTGMIRRLGGRNWQRLHRLAYGTGVLAALHFLWLAKKGRTDQYYYAAIVAALLGVRVWDWGRRRLARRRPGPAGSVAARGKSSRSGAQSS